MRNAKVRCRWCCSCSLARTSSTPMWAISEDACMEVKPMSRMRTRLANSAGTGWSTGWSSSSYRTASGNPPKCFATLSVHCSSPVKRPASSKSSTFHSIGSVSWPEVLSPPEDLWHSVSCKPLLSFSQVILQVASQKSCQWILNASAGMPKSDIKQRKWKTNLGENTPHYWVSGWQTQSCFGSDPHCQFLNEIPNHKECYSAPKLPGSHCWSTSTHATPWHNCCWHSEWQTQLALVGQLSKNG